MSEPTTDDLVTTLRKYFTINNKSYLFNTSIQRNDQENDRVITKTVRISDLQDVNTDIVHADRICMTGYVFKGYVTYQGGASDTRTGDFAVVKLKYRSSTLTTQRIENTTQFSTLLPNLLPLRQTETLLPNPLPLRQTETLLPNPLPLRQTEVKIQPSGTSTNEPNSTQTDILKQTLLTTEKILQKLPP